MKIRRILAAALVAVMVIACAAPVFAADGKTNMMKDASFVEAINIIDNGDDNFEGVVDGGIAVGPTHMQESLNGKIQNINKRFDVDGNEIPEEKVNLDEKVDGQYIWELTYELLNKATIDSFTFYFIDLIVGNVNNTVPWLLHDFDLYVSDTGAAGSWKLAYRAEELHDGFIDSDYYEFVEAHDDRLDYWIYSDKFEKAVDAKFVKLAVPTLTNETLSTKNWVNLNEIELYGTLATGVTAQTKAPETKAPAPVNAAGQTDVIYDSTVANAVNIEDSGNKNKPFVGLTDGIIASGPTHKEKSLNGKVIDVEKRYDVNGEEKEGGEYIWLLSFEMPQISTIETVEIDCTDLAPLGVGVDNTVPWLLHDFDLYLSDTGAAGSWRLVHSVKDMHDGDANAAKYTLVEEDNNHKAYYAYAANLATPASGKFVMIAVPTLTNETLSTKNWVNITEIQTYGKIGATVAPTPVTQAPATQAPVTQAPVTQAPVTQAPVTQAPATQAPATQAPATQAPATQAPATQAPATQAPANTTKAPTTQAQQTPATSPKTVDASVVIAVVIAAAASGAVVIGKKKH